MRIVLLGYGTMGKAIEELAIAAGDEIMLKVDSHNVDLLNRASLQSADVAIDFSQAEVAVDNITSCLEASVPVVSGTTGWLEEMPQVLQKVKEMEGAFLYASNFSVGVNILFALNRYLAQLMNGQSEYDVALHETHHIRKKDAPSGTAIEIAEGILAEIDRKEAWHYAGEPQANKLFVSASRVGDTPGTHRITYRSAIDEISLEHQAFSREGFAKGALLAAHWLVGKTGVFSMSDVLKIR